MDASTLNFFAVIGLVAVGFGVAGFFWEAGRVVAVIIANNLPDRWFGKAD